MPEFNIIQNDDLYCNNRNCIFHRQWFSRYQHDKNRLRHLEKQFTRPLKLLQVKNNEIKVLKKWVDLLESEVMDKPQKIERS